MGNNDIIKKLLAKAYKEKQASEKPVRKIKTYKGEWYTINSVFGNDWAIFYALLGGREAGKSYTAMNWAVKRKLKKKDKCKFYWFRLTETACDNLLADNGSKLIDPDLKRKYNIKLFRKNTTLYSYTEKERITNRGNKKIEKENIRVFCDVLACSTFYNTKGVGYFDNEFNGEYIIILDEMNREESEKNSFDIVYNFVNLLENIARSTKKKIRVVMIGNTLEEASDILAAFNFIPDGFGRYKLKSKRCVVDYIMPNDEYKKRREGGIANILMPEASTFTNEISIDRSLLVNRRRCIAPQYVIKFGKTKDLWFTVWNDNIIKQYNGEKKREVPMKRYLDAVFTQEMANNVFEMFDTRSYKFVNLATMKRFQKQMKLLKKK